MELKDQCTPLELSKRLKELGIDQYANFYWMIGDNGEAEFKTKPEMEEMCTDVIIEGKKEEAGIKSGQWHSYDEAAFKETGERLFKESCSLPDNEVFFAAFTASELGELLPDEIKKGDTIYSLDQTKLNGEWYISYIAESETMRWELNDQCSISKNESETRAAMLIYLLENKLVTP